MVRNEVRIIEEFCSHLNALFDRIVIVDHISNDGTRAWLRMLAHLNPKFEVVMFDEPGYFQAEVMAWATKYVVNTAETSWIFLLDADEFLPFSSREEFNDALGSFGRCPVIRLPWLNLVPLSYCDDTISGKQYLKPSNGSVYYKVAFQPQLLPRDGYVISQGNHALLRADDHSSALPSRLAFPLVHIPLRTENQLRAKISQGMSACDAMGDKRGAGHCQHWDEIHAIVESQGMTLPLLMGIASRYGEVLKAPFERTAAELGDMGFREYTLTVARKNLATGNLASAQDQETKSPNRGSADLGLEGRRIVLDHEIRMVSEQPWYSQEDGATVLLDFLQGAPTKIATPALDASSGHIPFLFALMRLLRPNLYVELGDDHGASFFAACQAIEEYELPCDAYAVGRWEGDSGGEQRDRLSFERFKQHLQAHYSGIGHHVNVPIKDVVNKFRDNSVSLLNMGDFHTYEVVRRNFEDWLPKMTAHGVVLFHNTMERNNSGDAWRLWNEIADTYQSYNLMHTRGLGVIALSKDPHHPVVQLLRTVNKSAAIQMLFSRFFCTLGALATSEASARSKDRGICATGD